MTPEPAMRLGRDTAVTLTASSVASTRLVVVAVWVLYAAFLPPVNFPFANPYEPLFLILGAAGLVVAAAAAFNRPRLRAYAFGGVLLTFAAYAVYWSSIARIALSHDPSFGPAAIVLRYHADVLANVERWLAAGSHWSAARVMFLNVGAPLVQAALGLWLLGSDREKSRETPRHGGLRPAERSAGRNSLRRGQYHEERHP